LKARARVGYQFLLTHNNNYNNRQPRHVSTTAEAMIITYNDEQ
jgi:hypothetical protein